MAVEFGLQMTEIEARNENLGLRNLVAIFDMDRTLVEDTFDDSVKENLVSSLRKATGREIFVEEVFEDWKEIQHNFRPVLEVHPAVAVIAAQVIIEKHGIDQNSFEGRKILGDFLRQIYHPEKVELCPGAREVVSSAKDKCRDVLMGTIAIKRWTDEKLSKSGLIDFFTNGNVFNFEVRQKKGEQWQGMLEYYGLTPKEVFIVGDSYEADIKPMIKLGVKHAFWIYDGKITEEEFWARVVPENVTKLMNVGELEEYLVAQPTRY